jgi:GxxExxY protein
VTLPVHYLGKTIDAAYRIDLLIDACVIVEVKATDTILQVHKAQVLTYLKLTKLRLGLIVNFNVPLIKDGIKRLIL